MCRTRAFPSRSRAFRDLCTGSRKCELSLPRLQKKQSVLMSVVAGEAVASVRTLDDKQVLQQCMAALRELFKEQVRAASGTGEKADGRVGPSPVVRLPAKSPGWPARAAVTKYPNLGGFNDGHLRCRSSEAGRSEIKVQAGLFGFFPGLSPWSADDRLPPATPHRLPVVLGCVLIASS